MPVRLLVRLLVRLVVWLLVMGVLLSCRRWTAPAGTSLATDGRARVADRSRRPAVTQGQVGPRRSPGSTMADSSAVSSALAARQAASTQVRRSPAVSATNEPGQMICTAT